MFTMRLKSVPVRSNEWKCCFCLHVRTATILLGIWHLILHVLALSVLAVILRNRNLLRDLAVVEDNDTEINPLLPTPLSKIKGDAPYYLPQHDHNLYYPDLDMGALVTVCTLTITLLLLYGSIKGKPTHLLPFFCMQLFDFAITILTATGYLCYLRSVHRLVAENWHLPWRQELLKLSPQCLSLLVLVVFVISMLMKAYFIGIVWRCYKFLTLRQQALRSTIHYIMPGEHQPEPDYSSLLPDYEAACASAMKQPPPPSYQAVMASQNSVPADATVPAPVVAPAEPATSTDEAPASEQANGQHPN